MWLYTLYNKFMPNYFPTLVGPHQVKGSLNKEAALTPGGIDTFSVSCVTYEHLCHYIIRAKIWMLAVLPRDNNLWVSECAQIMDEGEASCWGSLNINVVELQSISTLTQRWKKITCPFNEIKHTADISVSMWPLYIDRWMATSLEMTLVLIDILLLKIYQQVKNKKPGAQSGPAR